MRGAFAPRFFVMKSTRSLLLQHIVATHFQERFGNDWWEKKLLPHMREEAQKVDSRSGEKYSVALHIYGRTITFEDLDTTVLSTIILFDQASKNIPNKVSYSQYEIDLTHKLHSYRNKSSHEITGNDEVGESKEIVLAMRKAIDKLNLTQSNPTLAKRILDDYSTVFGIESETDDIKSFMQLSERFQEAEELFQWDIPRSISIYEELAHKGHQGAQKRLLEAYTKTVQGFDLDKAIELTTKYPNVLTRKELGLLRAYHSMYSHVIWGTIVVCDYFQRALKEGKIIKNAELCQYIDWITSEHKQGLLALLPSTKEGYALYNDLKAIPPDLNAAKQTVAVWPDGANKDYANSIIALAENKKCSRAETEALLQNAGRNGYLPVVEMFAEKEAKRIGKIKNKLPADSWIILGEKLNSARCIELNAQLESDPQDTLERDSVNQPNPGKTDDDAVRTLLATVEQLNKENEQLKTKLKITVFAAVLAIIAAIAILIMR